MKPHHTLSLLVLSVIALAPPVSAAAKQSTIDDTQTTIVQGPPPNPTDPSGRAPTTHAILLSQHYVGPYRVEPRHDTPGLPGSFNFFADPRGLRLGTYVPDSQFAAGEFNGTAHFGIDLYPTRDFTTPPVHQHVGHRGHSNSTYRHQ